MSPRFKKDIFTGVDGYDGDGDITRPDNLEAFKHYVLDITNGQGVHFVMADGVSSIMMRVGYVLQSGLNYLFGSSLAFNFPAKDNLWGLLLSVACSVGA